MLANSSELTYIGVSIKKFLRSHSTQFMTPENELLERAIRDIQIYWDGVGSWGNCFVYWVVHVCLAMLQFYQLPL
jgi:hypothetical protein